jgi:tetratricopeptide (TPR) repeat protein
MLVRRNQSQSFFRPRRKRPYFRWAVMLAFFVGLLLIGNFALTQPAELRATTSRFFGDQPTATPPAQSLAAQAEVLYYNGDLEQAADLYARAIEQRPNNIDWVYAYGQILIDLDQPQAAEDLSKRIIETYPNDPRGLTLRTRALAWMGQYTAAIPMGLSGLQLDPNFAPLYEALSRAYTGAAQWREAQQYGLKAIDLAPNDVRSHWAYANALSAVGAFDDAIIELKQAIDLQPGFIPPYFELAFLYLSSNQDQEAIDLYDRVLGMQPRNVRALLRQCEAYRKVGEFERALGLCQDAARIDPSFIPAQYRLGTLLYNRREFKPALAAFQACYDSDTSDFRLQCTYRLGLAHYYVAQTDYQICQQQGQEQCSAQAKPHCEQAWNLLETSLTMTQALSDVEEDILIIQEGMTAIVNEPACFGVGRLIQLPTPAVTLEATVEATVEPRL